MESKPVSVRHAGDMEPAIDSVVERILELPQTLRCRLLLGRPVSLQQLVAATGYTRVSERIDCARLEQALGKRHAILDGWLRYSAEKDAAWGWFFEVDRRGYFTVGMRARYSELTRCEIGDPWVACAYFIKQELDAVVGAPLISTAR